MSTPNWQPIIHGLDIQTQCIIRTLLAGNIKNKNKIKRRRGHNQKSCYLTQNAIEYFLRKFFPPIINQDTMTEKSGKKR